MQKALEPLILSWRVPELRNRLLFVLGMMVVYVFALYVPVPNVDHSALNNLFNQSHGLFDFIDIFSGGALRRLSILALGIMPYITSSIVFQILTIVFPYFKELQQEGEYGRRKMAQWTRWAAIGLTALQASIAAQAFIKTGIKEASTPSALFFIQTVLCLTAGTMFLLWLGERITERGVGNGISFIIFAGIVARLPQQIGQLAQTAEWWQMLALGALFLGTVWYIIKVTQGERRIPVKYAPRQAGNRQVQAQRSYLPLKMAAAGVIPIIFAISIVLFPGQIAQWYLKSLPATATDTTGYNIALHVTEWFSPSSFVASLLYGALVMGFTYFYTSVIFDVRDLADNLKRYGGQIPGYAPGRPTYLFINKVLSRVTFAGGLFLASIALLQWWAPTILQLPQTAGGVSTLIGGTSLLIVVGVALEIMNNLDQQLKMRQYEGLVQNMEKGRL